MDSLAEGAGGKADAAGFEASTMKLGQNAGGKEVAHGAAAFVDASCWY